MTRGPVGKQCRDCKHGMAHPHTDKLFYCQLRRTYGGRPTKTQRTWTCDDFTSRKEGL